MDATEDKPTILVGIIMADDMIAAFPMLDGEPTEHMTATYTGWTAANLDVESKVVTLAQWERIRAALEAEPDVEVSDFTVETTEETSTP